MMKSTDSPLGDAPDEEDESWSSDYSASDEEDPETFSESTEVANIIETALLITATAQKIILWQLWYYKHIDSLSYL